MSLPKLGLIINPIAGMGGRVGLKGTDGPKILKKSIKLGAKPQAHLRAQEALKILSSHQEKIKLFTYPSGMGEETARKCGFSPVVLGKISSDSTTAEDTRRACKEMQQAGVDLLLFAGGDGTARDIFSSMGNQGVVLGIPAGVKIHSAVFASNPSRAGELASLYLLEKTKKNKLAEVMDIDEEQYRKGLLSAQLFGYLRIPYKKRFVQNLKAGSSVSERYIQEAIAQEVIENMSREYFYIIGPGTTTQSILKRLNLKGSLLGVDLVHQNKLLGKDLGESELWNLTQNHKTRLIVTPIGGQGYILGRGNQQISSKVLQRVGKRNILVIATPQKLHSLHGNPLLLDTGDESLNYHLRGYYKIITGYREYTIYKCE